MAQKDVGNKIPIYKLKTTDEVMRYYDDWGIKNKYDQDMVDWKYSGPKETVGIFKKYAIDKQIDTHLSYKSRNSSILSTYSND